MKEFRISKNDSEQKILNFIKKMYRKTSLSVIYKWFRTKKIKINNLTIKNTKCVLNFGDVVTVYDSANSDIKDMRTTIEESEINQLKIFYIDSNIIIVDKNFGRIVHDDSPYCLDNIVYNYLSIKNLINKEDNSFKISHLHRLDKPTRGLIIYPLNKKVSSFLYETINNKEYIKKYYILRCENLKMPEGEISGYIYYDEKLKRSIFSPNKINDLYKECSQKVEILNKEKCVYRIMLYTGRKHQIRSICNFYECYILNDYRYGAKKIYNEIKIDLIAYKLVFNLIDTELEYLNNKIFEIDINDIF